MQIESTPFVVKGLHWAIEVLSAYGAADRMANKRLTFGLLVRMIRRLLEPKLQIQRGDPRFMRLSGQNQAQMTEVTTDG